MSKKFYKENLDTEIKVLTKPSKTIIINEKIPSIPTNMIFYAKSTSGKTNVILNLLDYYKNLFKNRILVVSSSHDDSLESLKESHGAHIIYEDMEKNVKSIIDFQMKQKEDGKKLNHYLILLEDCISESVLNKKRSVFTKLFALGRHLNISTIITSQTYMAIPSSLRRMVFNIFLFKITNQAEKKKMISECCSILDMTEKEFEILYDEIVSVPYNFMYIDCRKCQWSENFSGLN